MVQEVSKRKMSPTNEGGPQTKPWRSGQQERDSETAAMVVNLPPTEGVVNDSVREGPSEVASKEVEKDMSGEDEVDAGGVMVGAPEAAWKQVQEGISGIDLGKTVSQKEGDDSSPEVEEQSETGFRFAAGTLRAQQSRVKRGKEPRQGRFQRGGGYSKNWHKDEAKLHGRNDNCMEGGEVRR